MAAHLPCLPGSSHSRRGVLTSFVPSVHNQGASVARIQGHALWRKFLPATGSFFVVVADIRFSQQHLSADVFLMYIPFCHSLSGADHPDRDRNQISEYRTPDSGREQAVTILLESFYAATGLLISLSIFCPS